MWKPIWLHWKREQHANKRCCNLFLLFFWCNCFLRTAALSPQFQISWCDIVIMHNGLYYLEYSNERNASSFLIWMWMWPFRLNCLQHFYFSLLLSPFGIISEMKYWFYCIELGPSLNKKDTIAECFKLHLYYVIIKRSWYQVGMLLNMICLGWSFNMCIFICRRCDGVPM